MFIFFWYGTAQLGGLRHPGNPVRQGLAFGMDESPQHDMAWLHLSSHPRGGMNVRNAVLDTSFTNRAGV